MNELIAALTRAANAVAQYYEGAYRHNEKANGAAPIPPTEPIKEPKPRAPKKEKAVAVAAETTASPFGNVGGVGKASLPENSPKIGPEDAVEAARRGQEVMGLFIRRYLKASPTGLERAKKTLVDTLGAPRNGEPAWKLEHLTPQDWLKLTPIFERELETAAA